MTRLSNVGLLIGPLLALLVILQGAFGDATGTGLTHERIVLALLLLMATWWITEAVPIPVTSLLPLIVLPLGGVMSMQAAASPYMHPVVVLLLGGFMFSKAIEKWGLHERIALNVVAKAGHHPAYLIGGFMLASAVLSMWISNSATSIMMMPIALSVCASVASDEAEHTGFRIALLLGIAYACSIGGLGTPIGTPTNLIVLGYLQNQGYGQIGFLNWLKVGLSTVVLLLPLAWLILTRVAFRMPSVDAARLQAPVRERLVALGKMRSAEKRTLGVFVLIASLWVLRRSLNGLTVELGGQAVQPLAGLTDPMIAILAVLLCFLVPSGEKKHARLLDWASAESIPWGVLLLFGGGMSLAGAISSSGLSTSMGQSLSAVAALPLLVLILAIAATVLVLTEVTSNVATASAIMPVLGAVALQTGLPLETVAVPVALAASCAFMLPMATGPNAVAYATGGISFGTMARTGALINAVALIVITLVAYFIAPGALA